MIRRDPIFLHTSFRASSTWLWQKFRAQPQVLAYYEPFNEFLAAATARTLFEPQAINWPSGHPPGDPYFLEYAPLLDGSSGIKHYVADFSFQRFIPADGVRGALGADEQTYLRSLIDHAAAQSRTPLLACTRSLGRIAGIKSAHGGTHLFMYRPLLDQWQSYLSQLSKGQEYFVQTIVETLMFGTAKVPLFQTLLDLFWVGSEARGNFYGFRDSDAAFVVFSAVHLYLYAHATELADIVIDVKRLAAEDPYRRGVEAAIAERTALGISLADATRLVQPAPAPADAALMERAVALVLNQLHLDGNGNAQLVSALASDAIADMGRADVFPLHTNEDRFAAGGMSVRPIRIEMYGDSTTYGAQTVAGTIRQTELNEPRNVQEVLSARFPHLTIVVNNNGVGGAQAVELLHGWDGVHPPWAVQMANSSASIVVINFALNDSLFFAVPDDNRMSVSPGLYGEVIENLISIARGEGKAVVLCEPNPTVGVKSDDAIHLYVDTLRKIAARHAVPIVGHFDAILALPDWQSYLSEDGVHPSTALYAIKGRLTALTLASVIDNLEMSPLGPASIAGT